jgi:hypothetical protein
MDASLTVSTGMQNNKKADNHEMVSAFSLRMGAERAVKRSVTAAQCSRPVPAGL